MFSILKKLLFHWRLFHIKFNNRNKKIIFHSNSKPDKNSYFAGHNAIGVNTILKNSFIGFGSYIGRNNEFSSIKIGKFCSIGSFIINTEGRHPVKDFVSTHPCFFSKGKAAGFTFVCDNKFKELKYSEENYLVTVGNDVWIGDRVTILDGVKIGDGAIIGSNALVTKDVEPYTINTGVPSKTIRKRFKEEDIILLLDLKWWDKDLSWIKDRADLFENIGHLKNKI
jgi:acetyltransferase-like isoleucine patch superfamily enzyme